MILKNKESHQKEIQELCHLLRLNLSVISIASFAAAATRPRNFSPSQFLLLLILG